MAVSTFKTVQSFVQSLWNWFIISKGAFVDQNTANIRASICAGCHNNQPSHEVRKGCCGKASNLAVMAIRAGIIKNRKTESDARLLTCSLCGCDLKIKVWIPIKGLNYTKEDVNAWPSFCWVKKIAEDAEV